MRHKDLLMELVKTDFKMRYQNSALGFVWVLLKPFLLFGVLYLVFSFAFKNQDPHYCLNLLLGLILFHYFSEGTSRGLGALLDKANIILKINFPRHIAVLASVINSAINLLFSLIIFVIFWFFTPTHVTLVGILGFFGFVFILTLIILGFSFFASILYARFRDLGPIWEVLLSVAFYATPILYPISMIPQKFYYLVFANPLAVIIHNSRSLLITGAPVNFQQTLFVTLFALIFFGLGWLFFNRQIKKVAEYF